MKKFIIIGIIFLAVINLTVLSIFILRNRGGGQQQLFMAITQPVTSIYGKVDSVDGSDIILTVISTSGEETNISLRVSVTDETVISQQPDPNSSLQIPPPAGSTPMPTVDSIQEGDMLTVTVKDDLRVLTGAAISAQSVVIASKVQVLEGVITGIDGNVITIRGRNMSQPFIVALPGETNQKQYEISIVGTTDIKETQLSDNPATILEPKKLSISDLKTDRSVTVIYVERNGLKEAEEITVASLPQQLPLLTPAPFNDPLKETGNNGPLPTPNNAQAPVSSASASEQ